jgi:hypothetical protein
VIATLPPLLVLAADETPEADDVVAGPWGALMFVLLIAAVVFLSFSFLKQLRKARAARDAGVYGDQPRGPEEREAVDQPTEQHVDGEGSHDREANGPGPVSGG